MGARGPTVQETLATGRLDAGALMRLGGDSPRCPTYLTGNHTIAERMYRLDQGVMLYTLSLGA